MPLVFVHGVGSRPGADYDTALEDREDLAKRFMFKRLGYPGKCFDAFWGDVAAKPAWNWACLPGSGIESFGKDDSFVSVLASHAAVINAADRGATLLGIARESSLEDAIDVLWAACDSVSDAEVPGLLEVIDDLLGYAELHSQPPWLREVRDDDEFIERLEQELEGLAARAGGPGEGVEAFGRKREWLANAFTRFGEAVGRTTTVTAKVSGAVLVKVSRERLHDNLGLFMGDIFTYLDARGDKANPGRIVERVVSALQEASAARTAEDSRVFVLAHSLGGVISYDILSYFEPDLAVDVLVTVGSQVALFEELKRFRISDVNIPRADMLKVKMPSSIGAWLNVMDYNDVLGFATEAVFNGPRDYVYSTGKGALAAHGSYFRPSFFRKLGKRLAEVVNDHG